MTMYRKNRTLENADIMHDRLEWLHDECSIPVKKSEHGANCPVCGSFFNHEHAFRKPQYCEDCGCRLDWSELWTQSNAWSVNIGEQAEEDAVQKGHSSFAIFFSSQECAEKETAMNVCPASWRDEPGRLSWGFRPALLDMQKGLRSLFVVTSFWTDTRLDSKTNPQKERHK